MFLRRCCLNLCIFVTLAAHAAPPTLTSSSEHELTLLEDGLASLNYRVHLMQSAYSTLEYETYAFRPDTVGRLIARTLAAKAREGVQVRLLVGASPKSIGITRAHVDELRRAGVQVRLFHPSGGFPHDHRKVVIADSRIALVGDRNTNEKAFGQSLEANYLGRDLAIEGPIVRGLPQDFERYWSSPYTVLKNPYNPRKSQSLLQITAADRELEERLAQAPALEKRFTVEGLEFITDDPDPRSKHLKHRTGPYLMDLFAEARESIEIETPILVTSDDFKESLRDALDRGLSLHILANGFQSCDETKLMMDRILYNDGQKFEKQSLNARVDYFTGAVDNSLEPTLTPEHKKAAWGLHAKSFWLGHDTLAMGSYNADLVSHKHNAELLVIIHDTRVAEAAKASFDLRAQQSRRLRTDKMEYRDGASIYLGLSSGQRAKMQVAYPFAMLLKGFGDN